MVKHYIFTLDFLLFSDFSKQFSFLLEVRKIGFLTVVVSGPLRKFVDSIDSSRLENSFIADLHRTIACH